MVSAGALRRLDAATRELFGSIFDVPVRNLEVWDRLNQTRHVVGIAGNDSHQNVGVTVLGAEGGRLEVLDALAKSNPIIRVLRNEKNMGTNATMNRGLEEARGDYVLYTSADDEVSCSDGVQDVVPIRVDQGNVRGHHIR